jgi:hypothetical protein
MPPLVRARATRAAAVPLQTRPRAPRRRECPARRSAGPRRATLRARGGEGQGVVWVGTDAAGDPTNTPSLRANPFPARQHRGQAAAHRAGGKGTRRSVALARCLAHGNPLGSIAPVQLMRRLAWVTRVRPAWRTRRAGMTCTGAGRRGVCLPACESSAVKRCWAGPQAALTAEPSRRGFRRQVGQTSAERERSCGQVLTAGFDVTFHRYLLNGFARAVSRAHASRHSAMWVRVRECLLIDAHLRTNECQCVRW